MTPVVDAHHHFWGEPNPSDYPWMTDALAAIRRPFGPDDLRPLLRDAGVDASVLVQTRSSLDETRQFLEIAAATDFVAGVVGWVDLTRPDVAATLAALEARPDGGKLVGIRHQVHDEPDPDWLLRGDVRRGLRAVQDAGLAYDLLLKPRDLPAALATVRAFPNLRFVIDHIAKPPIAAGGSDAWLAGMAPFQDEPHVACKLSGMITEADWQTWTAADLAPYVRRVVDWFGEDRLLFGSDWPVCLLAGSYSQVVAALSEAVGAISPEAHAKIFGGNAVRVYGLRIGASPD